MSIEENKDWFRQHLISFYQTVQYYHNKSELENTEKLGPGPLADIYVDNEISMEKGMQAYHEELQLIYKYNEGVLKWITDLKGKPFVRYIRQIIKDSDRVEMPLEVVTEPVGKFQEESYGRQMKGIWVDQRSVGDSGDSYEGSICIQLEENKYLKFYYSM